MQVLALVQGMGSGGKVPTNSRAAAKIALVKITGARME